MKQIHPVELTRSIVFFVIVWTVAQFVRGEILQQLEGSMEGAGKVGIIVFALGLGVLKFYSWRKARHQTGMGVRMWKMLPWTIGIVAPAVYVAAYFATDENVGLLDWISLITELVIPVTALIFAYVLLNKSIVEKLETDM